jgi:TRAP-type C4-dicarboxylate transport system substrate-binding protein
MSMMRSLFFALALSMMLCGLPGTAPTTHAEEATMLRIASLAPAGSSWMKVLNAWKQTVEEDTGGRLIVRFYPGGSQGDERDFVRKMRVGQLDGGVVTITGLSMLVRPTVILGVPGFLDSYEKLDRVRTKLADRFAKLFVDKGFQMVAWGDAGKTRLFSVKPIAKPSDIKSMRPWIWKDDLNFIEFYHVVGAPGVRLGVPEVYPGLQTKMIDVVTSSALTAVALQWYTRLNYMTGHNLSIIVGGVVMRKDKLDALDPELREIFFKTAKRAETLLNASIRRDDDKAFDVMIKKGIVATDTSKHQAAWDEVSKKILDGMTGRVFSKELVDAVRAAAKPGSK